MNPSSESAPRALPLPRHRLSTRIVASSIIALVVVLSMVGWTLWLSWQLEGAGAAINDTGSLRMQANRVGLELVHTQDGRPADPGARVEMMDQTIALLAQGNPARPIFIPNDPDIRRHWREVEHYWNEVMRPAALDAIRAREADPYLVTLPGFVSKADTLVRMIEQDNARKTTLLRLSQGVLAAISIAGTLAMVYLLYLWIISPLLRLHSGLRRMAARDFSVRLPIETNDEFGAVAHGFNRMAGELQSLYSDLETRVDEKTRQLAAQHRDISTLYDMAAFLNQPNDVETLCDGFLRRVMQQFGASGGSVRSLDPDNGQVNLMHAIGLGADLTAAEYCMPVDDCHCGQATLRPEASVVHDFRTAPPPSGPDCRQAGFASVAVFRIETGATVLGSYSLHFDTPRTLADSERQLLETLGRHLGVALENRRLGAQASQLAVVQERGLMAQGLHDSLAQGLNFMNLQLQMLDDAVRRGDTAEVDEILPLLRTGLDESYKDVRELLSNFRTRLSGGDLQAAIKDTVARFRRQTGIDTTLDIGPARSAPLSPDSQLQILFILQEALSNVRKHAEASQVSISVVNDRDFTLEIADNGMGFDSAEVAARGEAHIGLHIMRERSARMNAVIKLDSAPGQGTRVTVTLPGSERAPL